MRRGEIGETGLTIAATRFAVETLLRSSRTAASGKMSSVRVASARERGKRSENQYNSNVEKE